MVSVRRGSLVVVGTGIQLINHLTHEARIHIENSEKVFYVVTDYPTASWLKSLNPNSKSLSSLYQNGRPRLETYEKMVSVIMNQVRRGFKVCAVFYGHPGVFVNPGHEVIRLARSEGFEARMLPGISAEDCLFADLGVDPGKSGCQSFEATDFLVHKRIFDPSSVLILWQIGDIGILEYKESGHSAHGIKVLVEVLEQYYGSDHDAIIYEASPFPYPVAGPSIQRTRLTGLLDARIAPLSTLYIPPKRSKADKNMLKRLNLDRLVSQ